MKLKTKLIIFAVSIMTSLSANASRVVAEGKFRHLTCSSVMFSPDGAIGKTNNFKKDYFDNMKFSITQDAKGYKMTTDLYSGQFIDINQASGKMVFVQFYNNGKEVAVIALNNGVVTYTNTSGAFYNRLCVGSIESGINTY
ncbi:hypothetical protein NMD64_07865 [Edwardsiella tarda]|uniref:hypothetical protein n=1 Tax=Edwardsiella tarda TaxID=636 RepID=UPI00351C786A